jgi:hypothetical protein
LDSDFTKEEIRESILKIKIIKQQDLMGYRPRCGRCFAL